MVQALFGRAAPRARRPSAGYGDEQGKRKSRRDIAIHRHGNFQGPVMDQHGLGEGFYRENCDDFETLSDLLRAPGAEAPQTLEGVFKEMSAAVPAFNGLILAPCSFWTSAKQGARAGRPCPLEKAKGWSLFVFGMMAVWLFCRGGTPCRESFDPTRHKLARLRQTAATFS